MTDGSFTLVPAPMHATANDGTWAPSQPVTVRTCEAFLPAARRWARDTLAAFDLDVAVTTSSGDADVTFDIDPDHRPGGYALTVTPDAVSVSAADLAGAHHAAQTLRQLAGPQAFRAHAAPSTSLTVPCATIHDHPRFGWRGIHLDVARHFVPKHEVMRFIDHAAAHHLNVFHFHLTDDQGWRMPIDRYPELTTVGAWRTHSQVGNSRPPVFDDRPHGGRYSKDDLREIVAHARSRGVMVMPEIDVPGHVDAAVTAYPQLSSVGDPTTVLPTWGFGRDVLNPSHENVEFFTHILDEVMEIFDAPFIGIGGDEVPTNPWRQNPQIVAHAQSLGLSDVGELHGWFLAQLADHLQEHGRRAVVWDEGLSALLPRSAAVTSWRGIEAGAIALKSGHDAIMAPEQVVYLDHRASDHPDEPIPVGFVRTIEDVLAFDPLPPEVVAAHPELEAVARTDVLAPFPGDRPVAVDGQQGALLGAQAQVWTEHLDTPRRIDYATWPRLAAFAEAVWAPHTDRTPGTKASAEFMDRLASHLARLDAMGIEYRPLDGPHPWQTRPGITTITRDLDAEMAKAGWGGAGGLHEDGDGHAWTASQ
ncbi:beta-N-acetylhexosaminidase [Demequina globuliformis]|uniref:beta-N-acetylhexosaminidase n=1 Tax=Demequina globuliformis TaxID=676202 RepID=UPI000A0240D1|nr:beta-N-acetylhexosaminidase [Demequina globuliformis]